MRIDIYVTVKKNMKSELSEFPPLVKVPLKVKCENIIEWHVMSVPAEHDKRVPEYKTRVSIPGHGSFSLSTHPIAPIRRLNSRGRLGYSREGAEHLGAFLHCIVVGFK